MKDSIEIIVDNKPFAACFENHKNKFKNSANYIFLDQNGIKEITDSIFGELINMPLTDILFFISSSYLYRFREMDEFKKYLQTERISFDDNNYHSCHRAVFDFYKSKIHQGKKYYLAPFSLKKQKNIYGLIFGSGHTYGLEKFLKICWTLDPHRGEANYDIDGDNINPFAPKLFAEMNIPKKIQVFERDLEEYLRQQPSYLILDIYTYGLDRGFTPVQVKKILERLKRENKIDFTCRLVTAKIHVIDSGETIKNLLWHSQISNGRK